MTYRHSKDPEKISQLNSRKYQVTQEGATEPAFDDEFWTTRRRVPDTPRRTHARSKGNRRRSHD